MTPEYVGYADLGLSDGLFVAERPAIEELPGQLFKYHIDFGELEFGDEVAAVCVSRPTNPTGNVLTDAEMSRLDALCRERSVPLIVDNAYGAPFPNILYVETEPFWNDNVVFCMSLSKFGIPGARTGIVVASEAVVEALTNMTAVVNLAVGSVGPVLLEPFVASGEIVELSRREIMPHYRDKAQRALGWLREELAGLPYRIHKPEGAFFLWLWLPGLPVSSAELYTRLKRAGVFVLSGHYFFPGLDDDWPHRHECLRLSYAQADDVVHEGIRLIGRELRSLLGG
jgi:valine--pyruvate aminotransferase